MSARHTPGPWKARGGGHNMASPGRDEDRHDMLDWASGVDAEAPFTENEHGNHERIELQTVAKGYGRTIKEAEANARLIAAAPELLAELEKAADQLQGWVNWKCPAKHVPEHEAYIAGIRALIAKATGGAA